MNYALILAGGSGSRFWPLSRKHLPKQFLAIIERKTLLEATVKRIRKIIPDRNILIVTNRLYLGQIKKHLKCFKIPKENIILEPTAKNTLPAIGLCARLVNLKDPSANLLVLPSDHYIEEGPAFTQACFKALKIAQEGFLCLVGIEPNSPRSAYGYINTAKIKEKNAYYVRSFKEKPAQNEAKVIFQKKGIFWNSGIFCFRADAILNSLKIFVPELHNQIIKIRRKQDIPRVWPGIRPLSIDYGLLEKAKNLVMVTGRFRWSDLGSWDTLFDLLPKKIRNNVVLSDCNYIHLDSSNTLVCSYKHKRLIACVGLENLVIVDTPDALLVCKKEKAQEIKKLVELLEKKRKGCV
jgi:mannose-1-phosphate guanylyltransferase